MLKGLLGASFTAAAVIGLAAPTAAAPPGGETLTLVCDELGTIDITTGPGQGNWTPGFVAGTTQRLIPYAFEFEFEGEVEQISKPAPRNGRLDRCEFGDGDFSGVVWLSYTPR
ncbi:MAG TPA: hypothetical protein VMM60_17000 [Ilumatobacter sp.]|nr:hypothetical protein [Ilumatobacter sp.]